LGEEGKRDKGWTVGENTTKVVIEVATAWAVTKALLPLRLVVCVWGTPWFARVAILPVTRWVGRRFGGKKMGIKASSSSNAAGTGATGRGILPKDINK